MRASRTVLYRLVRRSESDFSSDPPQKGATRARGLILSEVAAEL